ncbi:uncharacterized protein LY89DRAFT_759616 [Mollisia scopiformis]|uniref:Uncharacterized protein n=1 Tax=Mollisia scopiformis TaxID=149040 RepID=A0A194WRZ9_MOLSC|nr:uncharacterized protein LY89DRAFT_759616 [Mollisia scopiformis]KUJ10751.1 hypothetical protein LY89DRAFT_759616 [Mollisia scopiformis]
MFEVIEQARHGRELDEHNALLTAAAEAYHADNLSQAEFSEIDKGCVALEKHYGKHKLQAKARRLARALAGDCVEHNADARAINELARSPSLPPQMVDKSNIGFLQEYYCGLRMIGIFERLEQHSRPCASFLPNGSSKKLAACASQPLSLHLNNLYSRHCYFKETLITMSTSFHEALHELDTKREKELQEFKNGLEARNAFPHHDQEIAEEQRSFDEVWTTYLAGNMTDTAIGEEITKSEEKMKSLLEKKREIEDETYAEILAEIEAIGARYEQEYRNLCLRFGVLAKLTLKAGGGFVGFLNGKRMSSLISIDQRFGNFYGFGAGIWVHGHDGLLDGFNGKKSSFGSSRAYFVI